MIVGLAVVKNEDDIIEAMIRHNLRFLDHLKIIDNGSTDRTLDILAALKGEGLPCSFEQQPGVDHRQTEIMNNSLPDLAHTFGAHQIVLLDSDEFLSGNPEAFRKELSETQEVVSFQWVTYVPSRSDTLTQLNVLRRMTHRRSKEVPSFKKVTVPGHLVGSAVINSGSHSLSRNGELLPLRPSATTSLAHFPIRSKDQLIAKALTGSWAVRYRNRGGGEPREARHWKRLASQIIRDGFLEDDTYYNAALTYAARGPVDIVHDPIATDFELKYTQPPDHNRLLLSIIRFTDNLINDLEAPHRKKRRRVRQ